MSEHPFPAALPPKLPSRVLSTRSFADSPQDFGRFQRIGEGHYVLNVPELSTDLEVDHVRRDRYELRAELTAYCGLAGVATVGGVLFSASINLSSLRDRDAIARTLQARTGTHKIDLARWRDVVDELAIRTRQAEQTGTPAVLLRDVKRRAPDEWYRALGFVLPIRHAAMLFGDGDTLKTYTSDAIAVDLARQRHRVGLVDWEMTDEEHQARVQHLDPEQVDRIAYLSCTRPLIHERDRVARMIHDHALDYLVFDSVGFGCHDKPEAAESAMAYFREVRSFGLGSFHIAHTNKGDASDQKPFGSTFWFNAVRALWFAKRAEAGADPATVEIGCYPRKFNLGARPHAFALRFTFAATATSVQTIAATDVESLATNLSIRERIRHTLSSGARTIADLAIELEQKPDSVKRIVNRHLAGNRGAKVVLFCRTSDDRIGLHESWRQS